MAGHAFSPDTPWQREVEDAFGYVETPDQLKAIEEVKSDMEAPTPMDRLVCGDVGFGKTEVAVRAAFKAVQDGKQVAVLVPTTLLAQQHAQTFADRYRSMPVRSRCSRGFSPPLRRRRFSQVSPTVRSTSSSVLTGCLVSGVKFKDLGLLVVDEEQRFGVSHKEAVKVLAKGVDVLTLTANPIPRTLEMALTGIRDLSLMSTPPLARQPILTYVGEFEEAAVVEAIRRELLREGQVFYVHNWVQNIEAVAARLRQLVPDARVAVAHGQMDEGTLEQVVVDFWERRYDVLVCTTIIESGIDMPTVNTLVVDRSDRLGLGQLHQLRGRVGRAGQRGIRVPAAPSRQGPHRGGVRKAADDRGAHRARERLQDRDARPRDPRSRQPARNGPVGPHSGGGLRPLRPTRGGGRRRDEGRTCPGTGRAQHRRAVRCAPAGGLRRARGSQARGIPSAGAGGDARRGG